MVVLKNLLTKLIPIIITVAMNFNLSVSANQSSIVPILSLLLFDEQENVIVIDIKAVILTTVPCFLMAKLNVGGNTLVSLAASRCQI